MRARARDGSENQRPWPADKVERWAIERLIPYARNARTHAPAQIAALAASVKEWGWTTNAAQIEFWNSAATRAWADQYARMDRAVAALTKELLDLAAPQPGERVLDIGCGAGMRRLRKGKASK